MSIPEIMPVIEIVKPGGPEVLQLGTRPTPIPKKKEVLIEVRACGISRPDCLQRRGLYPPPAGVTDIPGLEVAGVVVAAGYGVKQWRRGDFVCALVSGGGYAQYCVAPSDQCLPKPKVFSWEEAASLPECFFTVWLNLMQLGRLKEGETILVHGGSSGIGMAAIQVAKWAGAKVIITAGTDEKCQACLDIGADHAINYKAQDFVKVVETLTAQHGVNVILDMVGGSYFARNITCLAPYGRLLQIALQSGFEATLDLRQFMLKDLTIKASRLRPRTAAQKAKIAQQLYRSLWPSLEKGKIKPVIDRIYPFSQASEAHEYMESGKHIGKIVLSV